MRDTDVPVKTAAGMHELSERRHKLHARTRSLLIAIHGNQPVAELRQQFQTIGDVNSILQELRDLDLIEVEAPVGAGSVVPPKPGSTVMASEVPAPPPLQLARQLMNESAVAALGLRAFLFTLKLERCYSVPELNGLLPEYHRVLAKSKGDVFANAMSLRVRAMLARSA